MKKELSSIDVHYLVEELQDLVGGKIDNIVQPDKNEIMLSFFMSGKGKQLLRAVVPSFMFLAKEKRQSSDNPMAMCSLLRKYLINSKLISINQIGSERAVMLDFKGKEQDYHLIFELFSKGNIIFCSQTMKILGIMEQQEWKTRSLKKGADYQGPQREINLFELKEEQLKKTIENTTKDNIGAMLAVEIGMGGIYSEEACILADVEKQKDPKSLDEKKIKELYESIINLTIHKIEPSIIMRNEKMIDATPFRIKLYEKDECVKKESFNEAVDEYFNVALPNMSKESAYDKKIKSMQNLIEKQEEQLKNIEQEYKENVKKGELLYEKYQLIHTLLNEIKAAREKHSWKDIKEKLKKFEFVKEIKENEGKILLEI